MIWPFPLYRNCETEPWVSALIEQIAGADVFSVLFDGEHWMLIETEHGTLELWNANRWYAWASQGCFTDNDGNSLVWKEKMPSRWAARKLRRRIGKWRPEALNVDHAADAARSAIAKAARSAT